MRLLTLIALLCLSGCQTLYVFPIERERQQITICKPFSMPEFEPIPDVPNIPPVKAKDKNFTDTILVDKIDELRIYANDIQKQVRSAYSEHINSCR